MVTLIPSQKKKTKPFQKPLSETSADANFVNLVEHSLYRFLSVRFSQKGRTLPFKQEESLSRPFEEVGQGRRLYPQPRKNCIFPLSEEKDVFPYKPSHNGEKLKAGTYSTGTINESHFDSQFLMSWSCMWMFIPFIIQSLVARHSSRI